MSSLFSSFSRPSSSKTYNALSADAEPFLDDHGNVRESADVEMQQTGRSRQKPLFESPNTFARRFISQRKRLFLTAVAVVCVLVGISSAMKLFSGSTPKPFDPLDPIDQLFARQSQTLDQARARYSLKNDGREPPPHYDQWYQFARKGKCLIDEYDQIHNDFRPFYQLAEQDPSFFKKAMEKAIDVSIKDGLSLRTYGIKNGRVESIGGGGTLYEGDWPRTFKRFARLLPNMRFVLSGQDEPRILFNYHQPDMRSKALELSDTEPFKHNPHPTAEFFKENGRCILPNSKEGFGDPTNDRNAFLLSSATSQMTTDLLPLLSVARISPCFSDILVPSEFYYSDSAWAPKYDEADSVLWEDKIEKIYWRGSTSGGMIVGQNYHEFPRFKLVDIAKNHSDIFEVGLSGIPIQANCRNSTECNHEAIEKEYGIGGSRPRTEGYKYKYAFDVDGNSFSGRYLGLMRTNSLVFKSTVFDEHFNAWLRPYEHYIPVLPDLSDLVEKIQWAISHDEEAKRIQAAGRGVAERILTDAQNDCYFFAVLLEYARLQNGIQIEKRSRVRRAIDWWRS